MGGVIWSLYLSSLLVSVSWHFLLISFVKCSIITSNYYANTFLHGECKASCLSEAGGEMYAISSYLLMSNFH